MGVKTNRIEKLIGNSYFFPSCDSIKRKLIANILLALIFSGVYIILEHYGEHFNDNEADYGKMLHFSIVTQFTIGYGDQFPISTTARVVTAIHIVLTWMINLVPVYSPCS